MQALLNLFHSLMNLFHSFIDTLNIDSELKFSLQKCFDMDVGFY